MEFEPKLFDETASQKSLAELAVKSIAAGQSMLRAQNPWSVVNAYDPRLLITGPFEVANRPFWPVHA